MANLSQQKRQRMLEFINKIREEHKDDDETLIALGEIENELNSKKYGLVWEQHEEAVDVMMKDNIPVFTECLDKEIVTDDSGNFNFLLEGDNLHSLKLLEKTHAGKIDVIYIDPPYNTSNKEFVYDDTRIGNDDTYKHSKWLSFMFKRLKIAKKLLSNEGCIFISIDQNEFAQLKLLCDDIFGENNFIGTLIWRKKYGGGQTDDFFVTEHEYIFGYRNTIAFKWFNKKLLASEDDFKYEDKNGKYNITKLEKWGSSAHREDRPTMYFPIIDPDGNQLYPIAPDGKDGRWRIGKERLTSLIGNEGIHWIKDKKINRWIPYEKNYFDISKGKLLKSRSIIYDLAETGTATKLLTNIFNEKDVFQNPKPIELIQFILEHVKSDLVLDFFAGSGTTGHSVLKLNQEDGRNRKFILCTNNENNICEEITYERIKRVINGYGDVDGIPANLKYYRTDFVSKESEDVSDELLKHIKEMIQLEHGIQVDGSKYLILLTDEDADELELKWDEYSEIKALYVSRNVLFTSKQNVLFTNVEIHIIPDDYFKFELQEVGEAW